MNLSFKFVFLLLVLQGCSQASEPHIVMSDIMIEAKQAGHKAYGETLSFESIFENNQALCGLAKKAGGSEQQFVFVRDHFLLQEISPTGEWDSIWFSECV